MVTCEQDARIKLFSVEDKWRGNAKEVSCIPKGTYKCVPHGWEADSLVKHRRTWRLLHVPGRKDVLAHIGNSHLDTLGCLLFGIGITLGKGEAWLLESTRAIDMLRTIIGQNNFTLTIR